MGEPKWCRDCWEYHEVPPASHFSLAFMDEPKPWELFAKVKAQQSTIDQLKRERDEALRNFDHVSSVLAAGGELDRLRDELTLDLEAARADAARMRLAGETLMGYGPEAGEYGDEISPGELAAWTEMGAALTPDDGWLARKIEEAVEPYRALAERHLTHHDTEQALAALLECAVCTDVYSGFQRLLGGMPTKEELT